MLPLCSRSRPSAPSSLSEWQCVRGCSDAMRNFLGRVPAPPPSARASLKRAHALWMPAHVSCAIANRRVKVCWHRWKSAACVRWLVALLRHWCSSVYVFGRACRLYTSVARRATVGKRGPDPVAVRSCVFRSETRSRHLTPFRAGYTTLSTVKVWAAAGAGRCALTCVAITAGRALR